MITSIAIWTTGLVGSVFVGFQLGLKLGTDAGDLMMWTLGSVLLFTSLRLWFG